MEANFVGSYSQGGGYSGSAENMIVALEKQGVNVTTMSFSENNKANYTAQGLKIKNKPFKLSDIGLAYGFPNSFSSLSMNKKRVGFTMFETTKLPSGKNDWAGSTGNWLDTLKDLDLLIVPSNFCKEVFIANGATLPIEVVPLGIDPEMYSLMERPKSDTFTFLMLGTLTIRKNPGYALSAFGELFAGNPKAQLILKTQDGTLGHVTMPHKNITVIDRRSTVTEMMKLYREANCFLFPSRGEGFGLPPLEAMATGLPTIMSNNTGMKDFANPEYNYPINGQTEVPASHYPKDWGNIGNWFDPSYKELKDLMWYVYQNQEEAYNKGIKGAQWVKDNWSYDQMAKKLKTILERI